jgi:hypothetical protein
VFTAPHLAVVDAPEVCGVDFPRLGICEARNEVGTGILHVGTYAATASDRGLPTSLRVTGLPDSAACTVRCDGGPHTRWRALDAHSIELEVDIDDHRIQVLTRGG